MNPVHLAWCRSHFARMKNGGVWGLPRSGLIFMKIGKELVLVDQMPHMNGMPVTAEELRQQQEREYQLNKLHFEAAGIKVRKQLDD